MTITQHDICQVTRTVWESTLNLDIQPVAGPERAQPGEPLLAGMVQICGDREGKVTLECSRELARIVARIMFHPDSGEPTRDEIRDALGEITNITAGNFKSLLGGHCRMSLPEVTGHVHGRQEPVFGNAIVSRQVFECGGQPFAVTFAEKLDHHHYA